MFVYPVLTGRGKQDLAKALEVVGFSSMTSLLTALYEEGKAFSTGTVHLLAPASGEWRLIVHKLYSLQKLQSKVKNAAPGVEVMSDTELATGRL